MNSIRRPTFMCIGVQKAGTSWLYQMVKQHPDVCVSVPKELHYFDRSPNYRKGVDWYLSQFSCPNNATAVGEFTQDYLWGLEECKSTLDRSACITVVKRVVETLPEVKLLVVLRNPVTRAVSSFFHQIGAGRLSPRQRLSEVGDFLGILSMGYYAENLKKWYHYFPEEKFKILIYEDDFSRSNKASSLRAIFEHIGVDPTFEPTGIDQRYNPRRSHFDYWLSRYPGRIQTIARNYTPTFIQNSKIWNIPINQEELDHLYEHYQPHNKELERILGRKLPW